MSAIASSIREKSAQLSSDVQQPLSGSRKIYVQGSREDLKVGMREVQCSATAASFGEEANPPITIYDTSGPYSDPDMEVDLLQGLPAVRKDWIERRNDTLLLDGPSSQYGLARQSDPRTAHLRFAHYHPPRRARPGRAVTQMHYARRGIITPEMEYVALREDMRLHRCDPAQAGVRRDSDSPQCAVVYGIRFLPIDRL